jgi:hypothetical protein
MVWRIAMTTGLHTSRITIKAWFKKHKAIFELKDKKKPNNETVRLLIIIL